MNHHPKLLLSQPISGTPLNLFNIYESADIESAKKKFEAFPDDQYTTAIAHWCAMSWLRTGQQVVVVANRNHEEGLTMEADWPKLETIPWETTVYQHWTFEPKISVTPVYRSGPGAPMPIRGVYVMRTKSFPGRPGSNLVVASWGSHDLKQLQDSLFSAVFLPLGEDGELVTIPEERTSIAKLVWTAVQPFAQAWFPSYVAPQFKRGLPQGSKDSRRSLSANLDGNVFSLEG